MTEAPGILLRSGTVFATGGAEFYDAYPNREEPLPRIYVQIQPEGVPYQFLALLDTGAHYCILNEEAARLTRDHLTSPIGRVRLQTAHGPIQGDLYTHRIRWIAEEGEPLDVNSTVLIPPGWQAPSILGYVGFLDRLRLAMDPQLNRVYFGGLD